MTRSGTRIIAGIVLVLIVATAALWFAASSKHDEPRLVLKLFFATLTLVYLAGAGVMAVTVLSLGRDRRHVVELFNAMRAGRNVVAPGEWADMAAKVNGFIEEQKRLKKEHADAAASSEREERLVAIGRLASGICHEIRNPLTNIIGFAALAAEKSEDETTRRDLKKIEEEARRCEAITDSILAFSRLPKLKLEPLSPSALFERHPGVKLEGVGQRIIGDKILLGRVIDNIVSNALEAGAKRIRAEIARQGSDAVITVTDDGAGIPSSVVERLFEPFATSKRGGLGLGLAISKGIVEAHGGRIGAANVPEGGARFELRLPVAGPKES